jgi:hypothetical protein
MALYKWSQVTFNELLLKKIIVHVQMYLETITPIALFVHCKKYPCRYYLLDFLTFAE